MAAYNVTLSDGVTVVTVPDGAIFNTYSVPLIGQNATTYGDDVAAAFLRGLENFAAPDAPDVNANIPGSALLTGQLWFDTSVPALKVWSGSAWIPLLEGGSDLDIEGDIIPSVDSTYDLGSSSNRWAEIWADDITSGGTLQANTLNASSLTTSSSSLGNASATALTLSGLLTTDASSSSSAGLRIPHGSAPSSPNNGDIWTTSSGVFVRINGSTVELAQSGPSGGVTSFEGRTGAVTAQVGDYSSFYARKDGGTTNISSSASWTFNNTPDFNNGFTIGTTGVINNLNADRLDGNHASAFALDSAVVHDTGNETVAGVKTFTDVVNVDNSSSSPLRLLGTANSASNNAARLTVAYGNGTEQAWFGTTSGSSDTQARARIGDLALFGGDNLKMRLTSSDTFIYGGNGSTLAIRLRIPSGNETTGASVTDVDGAEWNVGYNETPQVVLPAGTTTVDGRHVGKFLSKGTSSSVTVRLSSTSNSEIPVGGSFLIWCNQSVAGGIDVTTDGPNLFWVDGGGTNAPAGNRTIARNGLATVRKESVNTYLIWGTGIS